MPMREDHTFGQRFPAGNCQAPEACGQPCNRFAKPNPPFNFCYKHVRGSKTLPCFLLKLPTELRMEIFRYALPGRDPARESAGVNKTIYSLLTLSKELSPLAVTVLYEEVVFETSISGSAISLGFQTCTRRNARYNFDPSLGLERTVLPTITPKIRYFKISVKLYQPSRVFEGFGPAASLEDFKLFELRDSLQKFVEMARPMDSMLGAEYSVRNFEVTPKDYLCRPWQADEAMAVVVCVAEPLKGLGRVQHPVLHGISCYYSGSYTVDQRNNSLDMNKLRTDYEAYRSEWQSAMNTSSTATMNGYDDINAWHMRKPSANAEVRKVEAFIQALLSDNLASWEQNASAPAPAPFCGIARVVHLARVACQQSDPEGVQIVHAALKLRFDSYQYQLQSPYGSYLRPGHVYDPNWPEIMVGCIDGLPTTLSKTVWEDRERRYYRTGTQRLSLLKTLRFVSNAEGVKSIRAL